MNTGFEVQTASAQPVAWIWRCPYCQARLVILREKAGLQLRDSCRHVVIVRRIPNGPVEVRYAHAD